MLIYYSILGWLIYLGMVKRLSAKKYGNPDNVVLLLSAIVLFIFAAFRSVNIGADTFQYCSHFLKISYTKISDFGSYSNGHYGDIEMGYKFYNKFLSVFSHQQTIIIANSLLQILLISILIFRDSKNKWLSIFLYFAFCFYQTALNLTPSSFVSYFVYLSFPYIESRKPIKFLIFVLIGMSFHTSAVFFIPLYFLYKIKLNYKTIFAALSAGILIKYLYYIFLPIFLKILPRKYIFYIDESKVHKQLFIELLVYVVQLVAVVFCVFILGKNKRKQFLIDNSLMCWVFVYETILYILSTQAYMYSRGAFLFSPYIIIIVPELLSKIESRNTKIIATACIVIYGLIMYIARVNVNNVGTTMPYEFFFSY